MSFYDFYFYYGFYYLLIIIFVVLLIIALLLSIAIILFLAYRLKIFNTRYSQKEFNTKLNEYLNRYNFYISKIFYLNDFATYNKSNDCKKIIAIDNKKQLCFIDYNKGNMFIVKYSEVLDYEIIEAIGKQSVKINIDNFGIEGYGKCKELKFIIKLKRCDNAQIVYDIIPHKIFNIGVRKSSNQYAQCVATLKEFITFLDSIKNENRIEKGTN